MSACVRAFTLWERERERERDKEKTKAIPSSRLFNSVYSHGSSGSSARHSLRYSRRGPLHLWLASIDLTRALQSEVDAVDVQAIEAGKAECYFASSAVHCSSPEPVLAEDLRGTA